MAEDKKSFVLYSDLIHSVNELSDKEAGMLLKTILSYVNDENPIVKDKIVKLVFEPVKLQLKRDLKKYETTLNRKSEGGKKGMEKRWAKKDNIVIQDITKDNIVKKIITSITDTVTVTVTDNDNVTDTVNVNEIKESHFENFQTEDKINEILNSTRWIENISMKQKLPMPGVIEKLKYFLSKESLKEESIGRPITELKSHFINWLIQQNEKTTQNGKQTDRISRQAGVAKLDSSAGEILSNINNFLPFTSDSIPQHTHRIASKGD